ncbi:MAG: hypothetical protein JNL11_01235 [Bdellovibrionaceae bacterium]|nr:hypothetical protein [Pseudobdellovibrionaceae bacterium]
MLRLLGISVVLVVSCFALAKAESESNAELGEYVHKTAASSVESKDIDSEITNSRLRASTGSKSPLSVQTDFSFSGGSVYKPFGPTRPKLSPGPVFERNTKITGNVSAKYRLNENNHINVGTGLGVVTPGFSGQQWQLENPYFSFSNLFGIGSAQHVFSTSIVRYSAKELVDEMALAYEVSFFYTYLLDLKELGWQTGVVFLFANEIYSDYRSENSEETHNTVGLYPFAEYEFNSVYSFRTVYRGASFYSNRENYNKYFWDEATQSLGVGITLTRDVYLYPNLQWVWRDINWQKTNVSLIANINFF